MNRPSDHRPPRLRRLAAVGVLVVLATGASACSTPPPPPDPAPASTEAPGPGPAPDGTPDGTADGTAALPSVPVRSAALPDAAAQAVDPLAPVALALPALEISVPVDPVGVAPDGQMEIPPRAERAGWYRFGPAPGASTGTAVIAAHVDSAASAGLGPFARLQDAAVGDLVDVALADGTARQFAVTAVERRAKTQIAWPDVFVRDGAPRLVLVTCGGVFQRDVGHYTDNVIVTAEPVGGP
ncbi:class F sortase [Cellulomonas aerilata]|uniref:Class F sortase n=1 Tax=Cellulomonas aerilata TaxID=515326 RepID=A0A512D871_9CELL|nr:class F sortase [Cellulomonas aerilata]GEO32659.1 class F sortase [Cellulomonas aerilata]